MMELVIAEPDSSAMKQITYDPATFQTRTYGIRRSGRPKTKWFEAGKKDLWEKMRPALEEPFKQQEWENTPKRIARVKKYVEEQSKAQPITAKHNQRTGSGDLTRQETEEDRRVREDKWLYGDNYDNLVAEGVIEGHKGT